VVAPQGQHLEHSGIVSLRFGVEPSNDCGNLSARIHGYHEIGFDLTLVGAT
jgi:hypothetical protein